MRDQNIDRNLNPHKAARAAMGLYAKRYAAQDGGALDFWESLTDGQRRMCRQFVAEIERAPAEQGES